MDRIWGGFMDEIKEEDESSTPMPPASPDTKARQARVSFFQLSIRLLKLSNLTLEEQF